jgi:hypothetical protein
MKTLILVFIWIHIAMMMVSCGKDDSGPEVNETVVPQAAQEAPKYSFDGSFESACVSGPDSKKIALDVSGSSQTLTVKEYIGVDCVTPRATAKITRTIAIVAKTTETSYSVDITWEKIELTIHDAATASANLYAITDWVVDVARDITGLTNNQANMYKMPAKGHVYYMTASFDGFSLTVEYMPWVLPAGEGLTAETRSTKQAAPFVMKKK